MAFGAIKFIADSRSRAVSAARRALSAEQIALEIFSKSTFEMVFIVSTDSNILEFKRLLCLLVVLFPGYLQQDQTWQGDSVVFFLNFGNST